MNQWDGVEVWAGILCVVVLQTVLRYFLVLLVTLSPVPDILHQCGQQNDKHKN